MRSITRLVSPIRLFSPRLAPARLGLARAVHTSHAPHIIKTVDRPLPDVVGDRRKHRLYFGVFCTIMAVSLGAMIKYEAANSPVVSSTLQALRHSEVAAEVLGPNIRFTSSMPWISGTSGIAREVVDFNYEVTAEQSPATVRFRAVKVPGELRYIMEVWSITPHAGPHAGREVSLIGEDFVPYVPLSNDEEPGIVRNT